MAFPAGSYPAKVVADGATAYWRLGESSGTQAADSIGTNHGTISGGVTLGQVGALADGDTAMGFNGTGSITVPDAAALDLASVVTMEAWVKLSATGELIQSIVVKGLTGTAHSYGLITRRDTGQVGYRWNGGDWLTSAAVFTVNEWTHLTVIADESASPVVKVYVNGVPYGGAFTGQIPTGDFVVLTNVSLKIGSTAGSPDSQSVVGLVDEVAIYPTALTPAQIAAHYAARTWTSGPPIFSDLRYRWCRYVPARRRRA
jgi:hypothetical protein